MNPRATIREENTVQSSAAEKGGRKLRCSVGRWGGGGAVRIGHHPRQASQNSSSEITVPRTLGDM